MRKVNLKLVALLICVMPVVMWGADKEYIKTSPTETISKQTDFVKQTYNILINFTQQTTAKIISKSYGTISSIFNTVVATLLGLIAFFWLWKQLKNGGSIGKEEAFKALNFVIIFAIVYVLLNSSKAFNEFTSLFLIPQKLVSSALSTGSGNVAQQLNDAFVKPFIILSQIPGIVFDFYVNQTNWWNLLEKAGSAILGISSAGITTLIYSLFIICNLIVVIAVIVIHMYSTFLSGIYMVFLPIMIPLLLIPQTKSIFFAWVKSFIGITMYIPLSMIGISIINNISNLITQNAAYNTINVISNIALYTLLGIISCIVALLLLHKIPTWISELLGVANQGVGAGGAIGMLKTAGMGVSAYGKGAISNITSANSGKGALAKVGLNLATGGASGVLSQTAKGAKSLIKNGFKSIGKHVGK